MPAPDAVLKLREIFADHREHFRSGNYHEFQLRKQFLDPFFEALGWDMANSQAKNLTELRKVESEIAQLRKKLAALEIRKSELDALVSSRSKDAGSGQRSKKGKSSKP